MAGEKENSQSNLEGKYTVGLGDTEACEQLNYSTPELIISVFGTIGPSSATFFAAL